MKFNVKRFNNIEQVNEYSEKYLEIYEYTPEVFKYRNRDNRTWNYEVIEPKV
jgi:hypothetical protein